MNKTNPNVDFYFKKADKWKEEFKTLRSIVLDCPLSEELKWGHPCYTFQKTNIVLMHGFKEYCALMFCKGALLKDPEGILKKPGESTQGARRMEFTNVREIVEAESILKAYIQEAIEAEKKGLEVTYKRNPEPVPAELRKQFAAVPALRTAFGALTPGRQRGYILHFSAAKQSKTRESRIQKCMRRILQGKGMND